MKVFGSEHLIYLISSFFIYLFLIYSPRFFKLDRELARKILAWATAIGKIIELTYHVIFSDVPIIEFLPLHLCDIAHLLSIYILFSKNKKVFDIVYFWSIGAVIANITPDIPELTPLLIKILFFLNHVFIITTIAFMEKYYSYRPYFKSLLISYKILAIYSVPIMIFNLIFHANFLFLMQKPEGGSLMDYLGPWPYYIISLFGVVFIIFILMYTKYFFKDKFSRQDS